MTRAEALKVAKLGAVLASVGEAFDFVEALESTKARINADIQKATEQLALLNKCEKEAVADIEKAKTDAAKLVKAAEGDYEAVMAKARNDSDALIAEAKSGLAQFEAKVVALEKRIKASESDESAVRERINKLLIDEKVIVDRVAKLREDARKQLGL